MGEFLGKLSSYNIFNYLLPGIVFSVLVSAVTKYNLIQPELVTGLFVYYFIGMIISRIGSIFIEPIFKKLSFIKYSEYIDFINSSAIDKKIGELSEVNNTYRTFCSAFFILIFIKVLEQLLTIYKLDAYLPTLLIVVVLLIFSFSYRKQCQYIVMRIEKVKTDSQTS